MPGQHSTAPDGGKRVPLGDRDGRRWTPFLDVSTPPHGEPEARAARPAAAGGRGLVEQVTSSPHTLTKYPSTDLYAVRKMLNRERRCRRMRRCVVAHADAVKERQGFRTEALMVTLTYRPTSEWNSRQVARYVHTVRKWLARRGVELRYQWVIETTKAGRPHYHLLLWVPHGTRIPLPDASGQWPHGSTRVEVARRAVGYLVKYATKGTDHELPRGARLFGCGGDAAARYEAHRAGLPRWLDRSASSGTRCTRVANVGWLEAETGVVHRTPYQLLWGKDDVGLITLTILHIEPRGV